MIFSWTAWSAARPPVNPMPVAFEPNRGQDASGADFVTYGDGFALLLRAGRVDFVAVQDPLLPPCWPARERRRRALANPRFPGW